MVSECVKFVNMASFDTEIIHMKAVFNYNISKLNRTKGVNLFLPKHEPSD
jgi:hypothetical protein